MTKPKRKYASELERLRVYSEIDADNLCEAEMTIAYMKDQLQAMLDLPPERDDECRGIAREALRVVSSTPSQPPEAT